MAFFSSVDWTRLFVSDTPLLETIVRGSVMYLSLFVLLKLVLKRQAGTVDTADLLLVVLIADAAQNGMAGDYRSITDGVILVAVIMAWNFLVDWLAFRFRRLERFIHPPPVPLIKDGLLNLRNMRREFISKEELMSGLREQGATGVEDVKEAFVEANGRISVVKKK